MIIIRLKGGLGNQMFQYAFGRRMAETLQCPFKMDLSALLDRSKKDFVHRDYDLGIFQVKEDFLWPPALLRKVYSFQSSTLSRWVKKQAIGGRSHVKEPHFHLVEEVLEKPRPNTVYEGWWQSERYFSDIADQIRADFSFKNPVLPASTDLLTQIENTESVCLNVRRTDFLQVHTLNTTDKNYFFRAADLMAGKVADPTFFIFSDDMEWCAENLKLPYPTVLVQHDLKGDRFGNYHRLMRACKHFIIPNSSFAWWAVWLNKNPDKVVIAPLKWFNDPSINTADLVPAHWIRL